MTVNPCVLYWTVEVSGMVSRRRLWSSTRVKQGSDLHLKVVIWTGMGAYCFAVLFIPRVLPRRPRQVCDSGEPPVNISGAEERWESRRPKECMHLQGSERIVDGRGGSAV